MKSNTTPIWFVLAVALAAGIWLVEKHFPAAPQPDGALLPGLRAVDVTSIQVIPAGEREISVTRSNQNWFMEKPVAYPAQNAAIESLLSVLEKLTPTLRLTAAETESHNDPDAEFGFDNPQFTLDVTAGDHSWHLRIGNRTAPGDGVYVRLVGGAGAYVTDLSWLQSLPHDVNSWRTTALVEDADTVDWIVITNGAKAIELRRDATNQLWRMIRPLQARADGEYINSALQQLRSAKASGFITDDPKADLTTYGLSPAGLDLWLGQGTNFLDGVHLGKDSPENAGQLFVRRDGWNSVVTAAKESMALWHGEVDDFRDPHLLEITAPVAEIEVHGQDNFTLRHDASGAWAVVGEKFPVDMDNLQVFVRMLANLHVTEFAHDVNTATDLQGFGLAPTNSRTITLRSAAGDTNAAIAQIIFGATETNKVYVKRGDENFVYALALADVTQLPVNGWQFRDRRIWNFSATNITQITLHQGGRTMQITHDGYNKWSPAPGSQGIVDPVGLEETASQFGTLTTAGWIARNPAAPEKFGLGTNQLQVVFEMRSGEKLAMDMGLEIPSPTAPTALATVTLDGDRWVFVFPPVLYPLISLYLNVPSGTP